MPHQRKPPIQESGRADSVPPPGEGLDYSIESTTMRLKLIRLRRREEELLEAHRQETERKGAEPRMVQPAKIEPASVEPPGVELPKAGPRRPTLDDERPSGRVRHDERGMAVWDWAVATGEFQRLSATSALKKLEVTELKVEETARMGDLSLEKSGRDKGGGFDPYNQRGSGRRQGEAAQRQGVTGSSEQERQGVLEQLLGKKK
jgi:hypothetical protein